MITKILDRIKENYAAPWYLPAIALLAAANVFVVFLPIEPIIVGGVLFRPKTWTKTAFWNTVSATLATMALGLLVAWKGLKH